MTYSDEVSYTKVVEAHKRIQNKVHKTPVLQCSTIDEMAGPGIKILFKCENFQKVGAFKFRGATNAIERLIEEVSLDGLKRRGVVTHSSGNHAQALALAAKLKNIPAYIVMPSNSPLVKKAGVKGYGAVLIECEPTLQSREDTASNVVKEKGAFFIPPYNHPDIIHGQGTACLELLDQAKELGLELDAVMAPVGGGGLLSGTCLAAKGRDPSLKVLAGEPKNADDAYQSFTKKQHIFVSNPDTIADGLRTSLGSYTYPIIMDLCDDIITVTERQIVQATQLVWERMKIVVEPSAVVPLAALLYSPIIKEKYPKIKTIGIIFSGGNVDASTFFNSLLDN